MSGTSKFSADQSALHQGQLPALRRYLGLGRCWWPYFIGRGWYQKGYSWIPWYSMGTFSLFVVWCVFVILLNNKRKNTNYSFSHFNDYLLHVQDIGMYILWLDWFFLAERSWSNIISVYLITNYLPFSISNSQYYSHRIHTDIWRGIWTYQKHL